MIRLTTLTMTAALIAGGLLTAGCTAVLPSSTSRTQAKWGSFEEAKGAFDTIKVGQTTDDDLRHLGFDAKALPNIRIINYVDVAGLFGSAFTPQNLPDGVKKCLDAKDACFAYVAKVQNINSKRNGNVAMDLFGFGRQTHTTGWEMQATLVLVNKTVVYKMWSGTREIDSYDKQRTPLGPMQNLGFLFPKSL